MKLGTALLIIYFVSECGRGAIKGGRASPNVRPQTQTRAPVKTTSVNQQPPRTAEALAVLIQHLVFNVSTLAQ